MTFIGNIRQDSALGTLRIERIEEVHEGRIFPSYLVYPSQAFIGPYPVLRVKIDWCDDQENEIFAAALRMIADELDPPEDEDEQDEKIILEPSIYERNRW